MANEAEIIELGPNGGMPIRFTVADGTSISKGTLLKFADPRTASASSGDADVFAGIAAADKVANDGATSIAAYTEGIFDLTCITGSAPLPTAGMQVVISGANLIKAAIAANLLTGAVIGKALETGATGEVIAVKLGC